MMSRTNNHTNAVCTVIPNCYSSMVTSGPYGVQHDSREHSLMHFIRREQGLNEKCRSGDALPHFFHSCSTLFQPFSPCGVFIKSYWIVPCYAFRWIVSFLSFPRGFPLFVHIPYILNFYEVRGIKVAPPHREVLGKSRELTFTVHTGENFISNNLRGRRSLQKTEDLISDVIGKIILKYEYK